MNISKSQRVILYSLSCCYKSINQPLSSKPLQLKTSKITFIELLLGVIGKKERAIYKDLENLEQKKLIEYDQRMIQFTENGLREVHKIDTEITQFLNINSYFQNLEKPRRKLQTVMKESTSE